MIHNVHIELTSKCNLNCKMCLVKKRDETLSFAYYVDIIKKLKEMNLNQKAAIVNVELAGHGEPLLYENIVQAITVAKQNFKRVSLVTNGVLLTSQLAKGILETNIDHIEISVTGVNEEIYTEFQGYKKSHMEVIFQNIVNLIRIRKELRKNTAISMSYINSSYSKSHIKEYIKYWKERGVDRIYIHPLITDEKVVHKNKKSCYMIGQSLFIHSNGDVKMCCYDFKRNLIVGNIIQDSAEQILSNHLFLRLIEFNKKLEFEKMPLTCRQCYNMERKKIVDGFINRKRIICNSSKDKLKGTIWEMGIYLYEILPPNCVLYDVLYYIKGILNVF